MPRFISSLRIGFLIILLGLLASCGYSKDAILNTSDNEDSIGKIDYTTDTVRSSASGTVMHNPNGFDLMGGELLATLEVNITNMEAEKYISDQGWVVVGYLTDSRSYQIDTRLRTIDELKIAQSKAEDSHIFSNVGLNRVFSHAH